MSRSWQLVPAFVLGMALCGGPAIAGPYSLLGEIAIPATANNNQGGNFTSFDTGYFDPLTGLYFLADKSNASVDIISGTTLSVIGQVQGFAGQQATTSTSGPNGVLTVTAGGTSTLYAGDGNSTLKIFDISNPAAPTLLQSIDTGGSPFRVDAMAYSPSTHTILVANNANSPAFATLISDATSPNTITHANIVIPGAATTDGLEQPVWDPATGTFFISVPSFNNDQGGVAEIKTDGTVGRLYKFSAMAGAPTSCSPTGLALGASGNLMVGCGILGTEAVLLDPTGTGSIVNSYSQIGGTDEVWYDPTSGDFFLTGKDPAGNPVFDVIADASQMFLQSVPLPVSFLSNPHSIAVDSLNGDIFVPLAGNTTQVAGNVVCPRGCIAVYGTEQVPEPITLALFGAGLGCAVAIRRRKIKKPDILPA